MTPCGIEPTTFRFVAQHLNRCATAVPFKFCIWHKNTKSCYWLRKRIISIFSHVTCEPANNNGRGPLPSSGWAAVIWSVHRTVRSLQFCAFTIVQRSILLCNVNAEAYLCCAFRFSVFRRFFAKLRKKIISFIMSVSLSVCLSAICPHGKIWLLLDAFSRDLYLSTFRKFAVKIQVSFSSDKKIGYDTKIPIYISDHISLNSFMNDKYFRQNL